MVRRVTSKGDMIQESHLKHHRTGICFLPVGVLKLS